MDNYWFYVLLVGIVIFFAGYEACKFDQSYRPTTLEQYETWDECCRQCSKEHTIIRPYLNITYEDIDCEYDIEACSIDATCKDLKNWEIVSEEFLNLKYEPYCLLKCTYYDFNTDDYFIYKFQVALIDECREVKP